MKWLLGGLAALVLLAAAAVVASLWRSEERGAASDASAIPREESDRLAAAAETVRPEHAPARRELAGDPAPIAEAEPATVAATAAPARVRGRCVDPEGLPLEGVSIQVIELGTHAASGADGRFELELELPGTWPRQEVHLRLRRSGCATAVLRRTIPRGETVELGDIELAAGGAISGHVVDPAGRAVSGALVLCSDQPASGHGSRRRRPSYSLVETRSDAAGAFRMEGLPAWPVRAWAHAEGHLWTISEPLAVPAGGERSGVELVLEPLDLEDTIEIVVLRPDGEPLPDAVVRYFFEGTTHGGTGEGKTDEHGRYVHPVTMRIPHDFIAADREDRFSTAGAPGVQPGTRGLVLQLGEPRWLELRVRGPGGEPVEDFIAQAIVSHGATSYYTRAQGTSPHAGGVARVLIPGDTFKLRIAARGYAETYPGPFEADSIGPFLEVRLERLARLEGRITAAGEPVAGARAGLHAALISESDVWFIEGFPSRSAWSPEVSAVTREDGTFELDLRRSGSFYLRAEAEGWAPADLGPLELSAEADAGGLQIDLGRGGTIEGRVLLPPGESPAGALVGLSRADGVPLVVAADAQGRFRAEGLTPGRWLVERRRRDLNPYGRSVTRREREGPPRELPWSCEVREGEVTRFDLDLRFEPRRVLLGRVLLGGKPPTGWYATLTPLDAGETLHASIDAEGRFRVETDSTGRSSLRIWSGTIAGPGAMEISDEVQLSDGENSWELDLPLGRLIATLPAVPGSGYHYLWHGEGALQVKVRGLEPGPDGRVTITIPAGTGTLRSNEAEPVTVDVPAGGTVEVEL